MHTATSKNTRSIGSVFTFAAMVGLASMIAAAQIATPATAKTHRAQTNRNQTVQVAAPAAGSESDYAYVPGYRLPRDFQRYDGYQRDRQLVGLAN